MGDAKKGKKRRFPWRWILLTLLLIGAGGAGYVWHVALRNNVRSGAEGIMLTIRPGDTFENVKDTLAAKVLENVGTFETVAGILKYDKLVKPGLYKITSPMSNWKLVRKLRSGDQEPIRLQLRSRRTKRLLAEDLGSQLMMDESEILRYLEDDHFLNSYGANATSIMGLFVPNTYETYWTVGPEKLFKWVRKNYDSFWTDGRKRKAERLNLSRIEVITLASIVQEETSYLDERATVAGLYLNRLRKDMLLQADPTVKYAVGDFSLKRVLYRHLEIDHPYNTYKYKGLPPGPLNNPDISAIDAVLNAEDHDYLYMCAKCNLRGHNFSKTLSQHNRYAAEYRRCQFNN